MFGPQKSQIFGTYGEFAVGAVSNNAPAKFLLTKMKPGSDGSWENEFASHMVPWRELFDIEELTFDELLQRDLDDSRVAHDLIPYLMGDDRQVSARFFPPVLAVLVPKKPDKSGILNYYPARNSSESLDSFGDLFDFEKIRFPQPDGTPGEITPLGVINYNRQKAGFVIVDGQHRAMAVLALHRQINKAWKGDRYASFYNHLPLDFNQIRNIELPVCVIFLPDLHENNGYFREKGLTLKRVCREIFLDVNKNAKEVTESRQLLLDDKDFAAIMMRSTLSDLKERGEENSSVARIYSFAFGDADAEQGKQVISGQLEYSSATFLYKMHRAAVFGMPKAFKLIDTADATSGNLTKNPGRPVEILRGTDLESLNRLSLKSANYRSPEEAKKAADLLSDVAGIALLKLFDEFLPFAIHNSIMRSLRTRLQDPDAMADLVQKKCYSLLFDGSGVRNVFSDHRDRLQKRVDSSKDSEASISDYISNQLKDADAIAKALDKHEQDIKRRRAAMLFSIDFVRFFENQERRDEHQVLLSLAKTIFDTISTQAFQVGYLMAVLSVVEQILPPEAKYESRISLTEFISSSYIRTLNYYFSQRNDTKHHTLAGYAKEARAKVFAPRELGLRGLLFKSVRELNERQWTFFRYAILEIVHSAHSYQYLLDSMNSSSDEEMLQLYRSFLPRLIDDVVTLRQEYINKAVKGHLDSSDLERELDMLRERYRGQGKAEDEIVELIDKQRNEEKGKVIEECEQHIHASLGEYASSNEIVERLLAQ